MSLRFRLMALVVVALLPVGALSVWSAYGASQSALDQAREQLNLAASLVAAQQDRRADAAEHLLAVITAVPEIRSLDRERCQTYMESLRGRYPIYGNIGILDLKGDLLCHAADRQGRFNAADRLYFREAIATGKFAMGEVVVGRTIKRPVLTYALPVIEGGVIQAVAFAGVDVAQMQSDLDPLPLPAGARLAVIDAKARLVIERDGTGLPVRPPGTLVAATELREAARVMKAGYVQAIGRDGRQRLIAFAPSEPVGRGRLLAVASLDEAQITAVIWERARREFAVLGVVLVAGLAGAGWLGRRMIARPAAALESVANRLASGRLEARVDEGITAQGDEFGHIATALNLMAQHLQARQRDLETELEKSRQAQALLDEANRTLEQRVAQATEGLRQSNRELEAFSYSVSHDLRAPLAAVGGFARAMEDRLPPDADPKLRHYLARILAGARQMEELIQGLLQLARLAREPMAAEPVNLSAMARETLEWLQAQDPDRQVEVRVEPGLVAQGDARMLRTVFQNLLGNAWKFTQPREAPVVQFGSEPGTDGPVFFVRDNGVGFDMAHAARLFTPFQRLHASADFPGTGIGLATVQRVVERHGGRIWVRAAQGEGCTVFFTLPAGGTASLTLT